MQLLTLFLLLVGPYVVLSLIQKVSADVKISRASKFRIGLSLMFIATSMGHFLQTTEMAEMIPPLFPYRELIIFLTGFPELFGAIFIWIPRFRRISGIFLIAMLLGLLPFNIYAAFNHIGFGGHEMGPLYLLVRVPFQVLVMWIAYLAAGLDWFKFRKDSE